MKRLRRRTLVLVAVGTAAIVGGSVAVGATTFGSPREESQAVIDDAAKQLGVEPSKLSDALEKALENRVDAAVAAGQLTKEQGERLKARIEAGDFPLFFVGPRFGHGGFGHYGPFHHHLEAAASYLDMTEAELRTALASGKSLAEIARDKGKSVDGLVQVLTDAAAKKLDEAVAAGRITESEKQEILGELKERITEFVNGTFRGGFGFRHRFVHPIF